MSKPLDYCEALQTQCLESMLTHTRHVCMGQVQAATKQHTSVHLHPLMILVGVWDAYLQG